MHLKYTYNIYNNSTFYNPHIPLCQRQQNGNKKYLKKNISNPLTNFLKHATINNSNNNKNNNKTKIIKKKE